jgi:ABC-type lipoprotein export system ATPase subunit
VARALANDPDLILADEPTGNLDFQNSMALFEQLQGLAHELQRTILVVTHNLELARACDHTFHMRDGRFEDATG